MMSNELKPCPFCGGRAYLSERMNGGYYVECESINGCLAESGNYDTRGQAIEAWNRRVVDTDELESIADELEEEIDRSDTYYEYTMFITEVEEYERKIAKRIRKAAVL